NSISRVADQVCDVHHITARRRLLELLSAYRESRELINIGAYARGSNPMTDTAIAMKDQVDAFLCQDTHEATALPETCRALLELGAQSERVRQAAAVAAAAPTPTAGHPTG
ncbi:MAG: hypothetical protein MK085_11990, partial [Phycisphaerales bacterium]|nr:hypothetical protein [Phycisphaerales bacterium]